MPSLWGNPALKSDCFVTILYWLRGECQGAVDFSKSIQSYVTILYWLRGKCQAGYSPPERMTPTSNNPLLVEGEMPRGPWDPEMISALCVTILYWLRGKCQGVQGVLPTQAEMRVTILYWLRGKCQVLPSDSEVVERSSM